LYELSEEAAQALLDILMESHARWGEVTARKTAQRLEVRFEAIAAGHVLGHRRADVPEELDLKFVAQRPFVIAFDAATGASCASSMVTKIPPPVPRSKITPDRRAEFISPSPSPARGRGCRSAERIDG
jgi:plasmid stabilization system protein ParE